VRRLPLFADLDAATLKRLGRALRTTYVDAGETVTRKNRPAKTVYFIESGAVEVEVGGQTRRLGRGEMFGQMALLANKATRAEVKAIAPSTLLALDEMPFRRLLKRSKAIQAAVRDIAVKRGIDPETLLPAPNKKKAS
jgi:CPA1 family monovalent cation:H+ antiporter